MGRSYGVGKLVGKKSGRFYGKDRPSSATYKADAVKSGLCDCQSGAVGRLGQHGPWISSPSVYTVQL